MSHVQWIDDDGDEWIIDSNRIKLVAVRTQTPVVYYAYAAIDSSDEASEHQLLTQNEYCILKDTFMGTPGVMSFKGTIGKLTIK